MLAVGAELIRIELHGTGGALAAPAASVAPAPPPAASSARSAPSTALHDRPIASPAVRARAWELGVDLKDAPASGPGGRIMQADLDAYVASGAATRGPK